MRNAIEEWFYNHVSSLEARDPELLCVGMAEDVKGLFPQNRWQGRADVQNALAAWLAQNGQVRLRAKRLLVDEAHRTAAVEWVLRTAPDTGAPAQQLLGIAVLDFDGACRLQACHVRWDGLRSGAIPHLHAPWPTEQWVAGHGHPATRRQVESAAHGLAAAWNSRQRQPFLALIHDEVHLCPPWDYRIGPIGFMTIVDHHFAAYRDTCVTVERVIYDESQPTFAVVMQQFACTNAATGQRGVDADIAFMEVIDGRLRYWRNYFDAAASVQTSYAGIGRSKEENSL